MDIIKEMLVSPKNKLLSMLRTRPPHDIWTMDLEIRL